MRVLVSVGNVCVCGCVGVGMAKVQERERKREGIFVCNGQWVCSLEEIA